METHENIKKLREEQGLSQEDLAFKVGYKDRSSIAKVEAGLVDLTQSKIAAFANALHVTPAQLMGFTDDQNKTEKNNLNILKIAARDGTYQERHLTDKQLAAVRAILDQLPDASEDI